MQAGEREVGFKEEEEGRGGERDGKGGEEEGNGEGGREKAHEQLI